MAAASALGNWSFLFLQRSQKIAELGPREDVLRAIISALESIDSFGDKEETANIRMLQAIVTLMWGDKQVIQVNNITLKLFLSDCQKSKYCIYCKQNEGCCTQRYWQKRGQVHCGND